MSTTELKSKDIITLRMDLDTIDRQVVELLMHRFSITNQIGLLKQELKIKVTDQKRELDILKRIETIVKSLDSSSNCTNKIESISEIYQTIMSESRKQQNKL